MAAIFDLSKKRDAHIDQRLRENVIVWLTTVRPDGRPHSVAVWFLWDGESILIFSKPNQQKLHNIEQNSHVVLALDNTGEGDDPISLEGQATLLEEADVDVTLAAYTAKYGEKMKEINFTPEGMAKDYSQGIRIVPTRVLQAFG
ncbi:MAG TPA: TIGR03667 family PPOX class F420-dependent oxidoreductase [Ktedonobacteraceae bacterium]